MSALRPSPPLRLRLRALPFVLGLCVASGAAAAEHGGYRVPDRLEHGGRTLQLNGIGARTATMFRVQVYVAALYLEEPSRDPQEILDSSQLKWIRLRYDREISERDARRGWAYSFEKNCPAEDCTAVQSQIDAFTALVGAIEEGDEYEYAFYPDRAEIWSKGQLQGAIEGTAFTRLLLSTWIGDVPPTQALKEALLGGP